MTLIASDINNLKLALQQDTQQMFTFIQWVERRYQSYAQNCTTDNMTADGVSANDQAAILAFIGDLNRLKMIMNNQLPATSTDMKYDCAAILGLL